MAKTEDEGTAAVAGSLATMNPCHGAAAKRRPGADQDRDDRRHAPLYGWELFSGSKNAQPAADIFSLGVIAFELHRAQLPFARPAIVARALREEVAGAVPFATTAGSAASAAGDARRLPLALSQKSGRPRSRWRCSL